MNKKFKIDMELLKKVREKNRCLCKLNERCPCINFIYTGICECKVYEEIKDGRD